MSMMIAARSFRHRTGKDLRFLWEAVRLNHSMVLLSLFLLSGMIFGAFFARKTDFSLLELLDFLLSSNFKARAGQPFFAVFSASFASAFLFLFFCFLCGLSMWGMFLIPASIFFRGFGLGLTSGYLYAAYGWKGILFNFLVILPGAFVCSLALLLGAREGIRFSRRIAACGTSPRGGVVGRSNMKIYLLHFGTILGTAFLAALLDFLTSSCFSGMFSF